MGCAIASPDILGKVVKLLISRALLLVRMATVTPKQGNVLALGDIMGPPVNINCAQPNAKSMVHATI